MESLLDDVRFIFVYSFIALIIVTIAMIIAALKRKTKVELYLFILAIIFTLLLYNSSVDLKIIEYILNNA